MCHWQQLQYTTIRMWSEIRNCCYFRHLSSIDQLWMIWYSTVTEVFWLWDSRRSKGLAWNGRFRCWGHWWRSEMVRGRDGCWWLWWRFGGGGDGPQHKERNLCTICCSSFPRHIWMFTSSSARLVFSTASTWEAEQSSCFVSKVCPVCWLLPVDVYFF